MPLPANHVFAVPADPTVRLPLPGGRVFPPTGRLIDAHDPFLALLLADRSLVVAPLPAPPAPAAPAAQAAAPIAPSAAVRPEAATPAASPVAPASPAAQPAA